MDNKDIGEGTGEDERVTPEGNDNIVPFTGWTKLDLDPSAVLAASSKVVFSRVLVIGTTEDGEEYVASSASDGAVILWDMERAKLRLLTMMDDD